ncbi:MAG: hypothetical protein AB1489_11625 [Acidobacteriota bacterium]
MQQRRILPDRREKNWTVDIDVLRAKLSGLTWLKQERLLLRDLTQMSEYLPHWILTVGNSYQPLRSRCCQDNVAPIEGQLRCILCHAAIQERPNTLLWTGLLPVNIEGREKARAKFQRLREQGKLNYPVIVPGGKRHLMVPVVIEYPPNWPYSPPQAHYADRQYVDAVENRSHLLGERTMCLYAHHGTEWNDNIGIMEVIANRVAPHAFALMRLANGESNIKFFQ